MVLPPAGSVLPVRGSHSRSGAWFGLRLRTPRIFAGRLRTLTCRTLPRLTRLALHHAWLMQQDAHLALTTLAPAHAFRGNRGGRICYYERPCFAPTVHGLLHFCPLCTASAPRRPLLPPPLPSSLAANHLIPHANRRRRIHLRGCRGHPLPAHKRCRITMVPLVLLHAPTHTPTRRHLPQAIYTHTPYARTGVVGFVSMAHRLPPARTPKPPTFPLTLPSCSEPHAASR